MVQTLSRIRYSLISIYAPTNDKPGDMKDEFYESLDKAYGGCTKQDVKIVIGDANAQIGRESIFRPAIGTESLHSVTNDNGLRLVTFAAARRMAICSIFFARKNIRKHTCMDGRKSLLTINDTPYEQSKIAVALTVA